MKKTSTKSSKKKSSENAVAIKSLFDHINEIYAGQRPNYFDLLTEADKKTYSIYMVNRFLSMNPEQALAVNILQKYSTISPETHYKFCINVIPRRKQFNKYIKATTTEKYEPWVIERIAVHFEISKEEAKDYLEIFYSSELNKLELRKLLQMYGIDDKELKKVGL
jgi:hypothetical protein